MKSKYIYIFLQLFVSLIVCGQETTNEIIRTPRMVRENQKEERQHGSMESFSSMNKPWEETNWLRVIYRELDLGLEQNTPLYYPLQPKENQQSLFTLVIHLIRDHKITAYEYVDGYEFFDEDHYWTWENWVSTQQATDVISTEEIRHWYLKEVWYLDRNLSDMKVKIMALCPVQSITGELGEQRRPLFWVEFDSLIPFISRTPLMVSNKNNALTFTMDDYFRRRLFKGEIVKAENLLNLTLHEQYPDRDSLRLAQEKIEEELRTFKKSLYWSPDSAKVQSLPVQRTQKTTRVTTGNTTQTERNMPVRSVRRR